jgi:hypothetical protein
VLNRMATFALLIFAGTVNAGETPLGYLKPTLKASDRVTTGSMVSVPVLDRPRGRPIGLLSGDYFYASGTGQFMPLCLEPGQLHGKAVESREPDIWMNGKCPTPTYYEMRDNHARILASGAPPGVWVALEQTLRADSASIVRIMPVSWKEDVLKRAMWSAETLDGLSLRAKPEASGTILVKLDSSRHAIKTFTGNVSGDWAEGIVYELAPDAPRGCDAVNLRREHVRREWKGWLRIVDDKGLPIIGGPDLC